MGFDKNASFTFESDDYNLSYWILNDIQRYRYAECQAVHQDFLFTVCHAYQGNNWFRFCLFPFSQSKYGFFILLVRIKTNANRKILIQRKWNVWHINISNNIFIAAFCIMKCKLYSFRWICWCKWKIHCLIQRSKIIGVELQSVFQSLQTICKKNKIYTWN